MSQKRTVKIEGNPLLTDYGIELQRVLDFAESQVRALQEQRGQTILQIQVLASIDLHTEATQLQSTLERINKTLKGFQTKVEQLKLAIEQSEKDQPSE